ncbi:putative membrane-associated kinase regulator [Helianthus annuus]|nr:putative membrane-associated kinase regulator [Helianthus annuus]
MDVFTLLKFWRTASTTDPVSVTDFDSSIEDDESFFDLVFTTPGYESTPNFKFSDKSRVLPLDSQPQSLQSPLRLLKRGFHNNNKSMKHSTGNSWIERAVTGNHNIEEVKIGALLKRDNSLRYQFMNEKNLEQHEQVSSKRFSKDVINKYLNLMKVSKRSSEKPRLSDSSVTPSASPASSVYSPRKDERKSGGRGAVFRKNLGKSRSSSAILLTPARKSDDSVLQQDGIQGAILHCKRSYNSPSQGILKKKTN